jgi:hypothetical protein
MQCIRERAGSGCRTSEQSSRACNIRSFISLIVFACFSSFFFNCVGKVKYDCHKINPSILFNIKLQSTIPFIFLFLLHTNMQAKL